MTEGERMAAKLERTQTPGIFKRGSRYVAIHRVNGKQRRESAATLKEARAIKSGPEYDRNRGEFQAETRIPFRAYAEEWIARYQGNGRRGFSDSTRRDYAGT
jgi:integrase